MRKMTPRLALLAALLYVTGGFAVACIDLRDHKTVPVTPTPSGVEIKTPDERETINEAWRSVEDFRHTANTYIERRNQDILKEEQKVATIEGLFHGALQVVGGEIAKWGGPASSLALLGMGYLVRRRGDKTPKQYEEGLNKKYQEGLEAGKQSASAVLNPDTTN